MGAALVCSALPRKLLDEITELDPALQAKLLRLLDAGEVNPIGSETGLIVDVRIVAATNREARKAVESGHQREDLRLAQFPIQVPPLRDHGDDIDLLSDHFLAQQNAQHSIEKHLCDETRETLHLHE